MVSVDFQVSEVLDFSTVPSQVLFQKWVENAWLDPQNDVEVTLRVVDGVEMENLNSSFRGKARPTNVLAFPFSAPDVLQDSSFLGDVVLCAPVIRDEAVEQGKPCDAHWAHMVVHALLHLQGFDHQDDVEAAKMEAKEVAILANLGFDNPYHLYGDFLE